MGGLGLRKVGDLCSLLNLWWRFAREKEIWRKVICALYENNSDASFPRVIRRHNLSRIWSDILKIEILNAPLFTLFLNNLKLVV